MTRLSLSYIELIFQKKINMTRLLVLYIVISPPKIKIKMTKKVHLKKIQSLK